MLWSLDQRTAFRNSHVMTHHGRHQLLVSVNSTEQLVESEFGC